MEKIKVLIVEDKLLFAEDLASKLKKHSLEVIGSCRSGEEAIVVAQEQNPDLILMDIHLEGAMDGISAAAIIHEHQFIPIIYLSDYTDGNTVERAKKTKPANYLSKPVHESDLIRAIDIAFTNAKELPVKNVRTTPYVFLKAENQKYVKFAYDDILFLEAGRSYCKVVTVTGEFIMSNPMNHIHDQLNHRDFLRVHRSHIVNINKIDSLDGNVIKIGDHEIQMSKEYRDELMGMIRVVK